MAKRNIGIYNNNWKGGHRSDPDLSPVTLPDRRILEIRIETGRDLLAPGVIIELSGSTFRAEISAKLAEAERQLAELNAQAAYTQIDKILGAEPATQAQMESMEELFITIDSASASAPEIQTARSE